LDRETLSVPKPKQDQVSLPTLESSETQDLYTHTLRYANWWRQSVNLVINSQAENSFDGDCTVQDLPYSNEPICEFGLQTVLDIDAADAGKGDVGVIEPTVELGKPLQDWFEMALQVETPKRGSVRASWGEDEDETEEEPIKEDAEEEEADPFEDFDEDDFDDDFDDDFEEELDDEYEIEPADDGLVTDADADLANGDVHGEDEEIGPDIEEVE